MAAARVLILGGYGETGRRIARYLLEWSDCQLLLAGRSFDRAQELADELNGHWGSLRATPLELDASSPSQLLAALGGVTVLVQAGPPQAPEILRGMAEAALKAGCHWIDLQLDPSQQASIRPLDERIRQAGLHFASQAGFHPGLAATMVNYAVRQHPDLREAVVSSYLNPEGGLPLTAGAAELAHLFRDYRPRIFRDGEWRSLSAVSREAMTKVDFSFGVGVQLQAVMELEEMLALPELHPQLQSSWFQIGSNDWVTNYLVGPFMLLGMKLLPFISDRAWGRLYLRSTRLFARPPWATVLQLDGQAGEGEDPLRLALRHDDAYELTAMSVVALLLQMLDPDISLAPGATLAALLAEPGLLLAALVAMGVECGAEGIALPLTTPQLPLRTDTDPPPTPEPSDEADSDEPDSGSSFLRVD